MRTTRISLVDDHALLRAGIRALLEKIPGLSIAGEMDNGRDAIEEIAAVHPDLVLMDIAMPGLNGLEALARIHNEVRVVILTMHANEEYVIRAMRSGAVGYLLKNSKPAELEHAIETVTSGEIYITPVIAKRVADYLSRSGQPHDPLAQLTKRQREILQLIAEGQSTKEIAHILSISVKTVEMHRALLMERLQIYDIAGLVRYAVRIGLVE